MIFRAISDGSEQRRKNNAYKVKTEEIEAEYPHAAYILKSFSDEYANNAKNDYEDSETNII